MWVLLIYIFASVLYTGAIRVPVDNIVTKAPITIYDTQAQETQNTPIYYISDDSLVENYFTPPNIHRPEQLLPDVIVTPATYLLPPTQDKQTDYIYTPTEPIEQNDWYPIAPGAPAVSQVNGLPQAQSDVIPILQIVNQSEPIEIISKLRKGKVFEGDRIVPVPSRNLEPPAEDAPDVYAKYVVNYDPELTSAEIEHEKPPSQPNFKLRHKKPVLTLPVNFRPKPRPHPLYAPDGPKVKNPTRLYPKKYPTGFKPIPIPISLYSDESPEEVPRAKPVKPFKPHSNVDGEFLTPSDEKKIYLYQQAEKKRKLKEENNNVQPQTRPEVYERVPAEQDASETHYREPERNVYAAPIRQPPPVVPVQSPKLSADGERTEFRMHGMKGPHSYQFGYDTGKGKNRQFRYEERDNDGHVRGHYGYVDKHGKLRVVNYDADPEHGFRAEAPVEKE